MLNIFTLANGRLFQEEIESLEELSRFQPIWVDDVAHTFVRALATPQSAGCSYDLCGPRVYTLRELVAIAGRISGHPRPILGLPTAVAWIQAWAMEFVPGAPLTRDNLRSMQVDSVCAATETAGCELPFGRRATPLEVIAPALLG